MNTYVLNGNMQKINNNEVNKLTTRKINYPLNLLKAINADITEPTDDQIAGLDFVLRSLKDSWREVVRLHYEEGLTYKETSLHIGKSVTRCSQLASMAVRRLQNKTLLPWIIEGYQGRINNLNKAVEVAKEQFIADGKYEQAELLEKSPDALQGIKAQYAILLANVGIYNIGMLREQLKEDSWESTIPGIGEKSSKFIVLAMFRSGLIEEDFAAYRAVEDKR